MFKSTPKSLKGLFAASLLALSGQALADDTEIYFNTNSNNVGTTPQVIFHIEYTANLSANICNVASRDAITESTCSSLLPLKNYLADTDFDDGAILQFEMTRAALKRVLAPLGGMKVGLLMPHNNTNGCAGPDAVDCSAGGYILHRMVMLDADVVPDNFNPENADELQAVLDNDPNKASLFAKLDALRQPQGNFAHPNQLKEIYFELYRYLTGQEVYNGKNGYVDFGTDNTYNLGDWDKAGGSSGDYACASGDTCLNADGSIDPTGLYVKNTASVTPSFNGDAADMSNTDPYFFTTDNLKWDEDAISNDYYISPLLDCSKVFVINILDGAGNQQDDADDDIDDPLASGGINFSPSNDDKGFVEMVRWLHDKDLADGSVNGVQQDGGSATTLDFLDKQNVTSFFIAKQYQQLDAAAAAGGSGTAVPLVDDPQAVINAIENVFKDILSVSTTFVSASIPVNVFNRSEVLDNAYLALFQTNEDNLPSWTGDVKKLKLTIYSVCETYDTDGTTCLESTNYLRLVDSLGNDAVSDADGRINASALTFWTDPLGYDLFDNIQPDENSGRDGKSVNRGGAGQRIPDYLASTQDGTTLHYEAGNVSLTHSDGSGRQVYYVNNSGTIEGLDSSDISAVWTDMYQPSDNYKATQWITWDYINYLVSQNINTLTIIGDPSNDLSQGYMDSCETFNGGTWHTASPCTVQDIAANVIAYIRGKDVSDTDGDNIHDETRRWIFGDPLHSRPLPINYGARGSYTVDNPDVRLLVGSNDGFLRMIRNTTTSAGESGKEEWAFMPRESIAIQKQLMDNEVDGSPVHPYGLDGSVSAYVVDADGTITDESGGTDVDGDGVIDKVWIYFGFRRGGQSYYALDVTNPDAKPKFMWRITPATSGFGEMGYTFSTPVIRLLDWGNGAKPVVIVGGGYDKNKDAHTLGTDDTMGNAIYIIDAETGDLVWKVTDTSGTDTYVLSEMVDSIPSKITAVDSTGDGLIDLVYVGDTGGSVWRLDLHGNDKTAWQGTKIMNLGRHNPDLASTDLLANDRRFFHAPDVVPARDTTSNYYAIVQGSGDRSNPLGTDTDDAVFMYKDRHVLSPLPAGTTALKPADLFDATDNCRQEVDVSCTTTNEAKLDYGWMLSLTIDGEKSLATPLTLRGVTYFSSYTPLDPDSTDKSCGPEEGVGYQYAVALGDAVAAIDYDSTNTVTVDGTEQELQIEDRRRKLKSSGIPSENVYVAFRDGTGNEFAGILSSDLQAGKNLGAQYWRTYWMEKEK